MNLKVVQSTKLADAKAVIGVGWYNGTDFIAVTEEKQVQRFSLNNSLHSDMDPKMICELPTYPICMQWCHTQFGVNPDIFAVGMSDGSLLIINANGRIEKTIANAHNGAVTSLSWNHDGSSLATGGEDGVVKLWSPQGHLRAKLAQLSAPVLALAWDAASQFVLCAHNNQLIKKAVGPGTKDVAFVGHSGVVLCLSYSPVLDLFLSGGEDNIYKLWDGNGRCIYTSEPLDLPVTSLAFAPSGQSFAVGTYDCVLLCDPKGWVSDRLLLTPNITNSRSGLGIGSVYSLSYSPDGAALALGGASGSVATACVFNMRSEWEGWVCYSGANNNVYVGQIGKDEEEVVDVGSRVTGAVLGYSHLITTTPNSICVYPLTSLSTPITIDASLPSAVKMCQSHFAFVDNTVGIRIYTYSGKLLSSFKFPGFRSELVTPLVFDIASDIAIAIPSATPTKLLMFDCMSGRSLATYTHTTPLSSVTLSCGTESSERIIAFTDIGRDLYAIPANKMQEQSAAAAAMAGPTPTFPVGAGSTAPVPTAAVKLLSQVESVIFHSSYPTLLAIADNRLNCYWYPNAYFTDLSIAPHTMSKMELPIGIGKNALLLPSFGHRADILAANGTYHTLALSPLPPTLTRLCRGQQWRQAMVLCRNKNDVLSGTNNEGLWAILACLAVVHQQVDVAELAFAKLDEVDKVEYMQYIRSLPSPHARAAELLLYCKRTEDAQRLLLQAGLAYRAIKLCIRTFRWEKALTLAVQLQQHVDTVLYHRQLFLSSVAQQESLPQYIDLYSRVQVDANEVKRKEEEEERNERMNATPYSGHFLSGATI